MDAHQIATLLRRELATSHNPDIIAAGMLGPINDAIAEGYLNGQLDTVGDRSQAQCTEPGCSNQVHLNLSTTISTSQMDRSIDTSESDWTLMCTSGHVLDAGGPSLDGRPLSVGVDKLRELVSQ